MAVEEVEEARKCNSTGIRSVHVGSAEFIRIGFTLCRWFGRVGLMFNGNIKLVLYAPCCLVNWYDDMLRYRDK